MTKYERLKTDLETHGTGKMKVFGSSMTPKIESGAFITFQKCDEYKVGDMVFCKVKGRYIDCHLITKVKEGEKSEKRYMISNNHHFENGWTKTIYGKAVTIEYSL